MTKVSLNKEIPTHQKKPIIICAVAALIFTAISCACCFFYYEGEYIDGEFIGELKIGFLSLIEFLCVLIEMVCCVLFVQYIRKIRAQGKGKLFIPSIFGLLAVNAVFIILNIYNRVFMGYGVLYFVATLFGVIAFPVALVSALRGFKNKVFPMMALLPILLLKVISIFEIFGGIMGIGDSVVDEMPFYAFATTIGTISEIMLLIALIVFVKNNKIIPIIKLKIDEDSDPEEALQFLADDLELGIITIEEYKKQRAEIISNL